MSSIDLIRAFQTMGCDDDMKCAIASMVYLDLKDDSKIIKLEQHYDNDLDLIYFHCQRESCESNNFIVPFSSSEKMDMNRLEDIQRKLNSKTNNITIAICDPSSTILYYSSTNDFVEK
ncbi:uncharacterized protein LOC129951454 [Eupeodes corollae]|uniref:uncharacterized protein LOC129951454 n=1 Tax=Eupeodes corollae TaxID=290404 RepID=UPI0024915B14|nr:uncharacterized protein LOC129951454 [Eupeodes corollae]